MNLFKCFTAFFLFVAASFSLNAQSSKITGKVISDQGSPVSNATIFLNERTWAVTNEQGVFELNEVPSGQQSLTINSLGFFEKNLSVNVTGQKTIELEIILEGKIYENELAVVTATRTKQSIEDVSIPVSVITAEEVQKTGANTVMDILSEQAGIALAPNESSAIQIQGFDSDYTLVMINGQPVVGRTRGALDLSRINIQNVEQIEIVKGPSSSLWGSEAFAGVINVITKEQKETFSASAFSEYGSRNTHNSGLNLGFSNNNSSVQINGSINGSDGFDLDENEYGNNQNPYTNFSFGSSATHEFSELLSANAAYRYARNTFSGPTITSVQGEQIEIDQEGWQDEQSLTLETDFNPIERFDITLTGYATRYEDYSSTLFDDPSQNNVVLGNEQGFNRIELQSDYVWKNDQITTIGGGLTSEFVKADRYQGKRTQSGSFLYAQHQLFSWEKFNITAGARLDNHSSYESYLSPKLSAQYIPFDFVTFRMSVGRGFKAPDFRTLYLDFDNAGSGYRVIGALNIQEYLNELEEQDRIRTYFIDPGLTTSLSPEYSTAYNFGFDIKPTNDFLFKANFFRNNAENLIDAVSVAELNDGSELFGYVNINEAYTQGVEAEFRYSVNKDLQLDLGYQYLKAVQVLQDTVTVLEGGEIIDKPVDVENPLPRRPKHSGSIKISYKEPLFGLETSLRTLIRSEYFYNDNNANRKADESEFAPGYSIWNFSVAKSLSSNLRIQFGIDNLTNHTDPEYLRFQPGRTFFGKIFLTLN